MAVAGALQLEHRQMVVLMRISQLYSRTFGQELTLSEADIPYRKPFLSPRLNSLEHEVLMTQDSATRNEGEASGRASGGVIDGNGEGRVEDKSWRTLGEHLDEKHAARLCETDHAILGDSGGEVEHPRLEEDCDGVEKQLTRILIEAGAIFSFKRVPSDYYERSFEERRDLLRAASIHHLCKSIVMVNTQAHESVKDCTDRNNSKYYVIVIQYAARLNAEKVRHFVHSLNNGKIPKKRFNLRLASEEVSKSLTGFEHNAVTPFGMLTNMPVILSDAIVNLKPEFFWLGGGEIDLKLGIETRDFINIINPFVVDCIY